MIKTLIAAAITFIVMDLLWLGVLAKKFYVAQFGQMLRLSGGNLQPAWWSAILVYIALIGGILIFVVPKAQGSVLMGLAYGAVFGFVTYGTYDFTNFAVMANWPLVAVIVDVIWGMVICGVSSLVAVWVAGV